MMKNIPWKTMNNMSGMFYGNSEFNADISSWDTSSVYDMSYMFAGATAFNQDLSGWCVKNIYSKPTYFDEGATGWILPDSQPVWGTCP